MYMSKNFTCCELVQKIKLFQAQTNWETEQNCLANEFLYKAAFNYFCEECKKWFGYQEELQLKLVKAEVEKEKQEGVYCGPKNPKTYEGTIMEDTIKKLREQEKSLPFGKRP